TNKMYIGSQYRISVWVKLAPGEAPIAARVSLQRTLDTATSFHTVVGNTQVTADQWVLLTAVYNYAFNHSALSLYVETAGTTPVRAPSFYIDDFTLTYIPPPEIEQNIPSVFGTLADYFHVGAAIEQTEITGVHGDLLKKHFDSVTLGNAMKPGPMQPTEGTFNFAPADVMVGFARNNNMLVRGHTLVWHQQNPAWLFLDADGNNMQPTPENKALLLQRLENHIRGVVSHYRDDVYVWDVLNEIIDPGQANGFRRSPWYLITGTDYIETALRVTHEVAPNAKLYINDYDTTNPVKRMFLYNLARDLKSRGVPLDGIGHQMHNNIDYPSAAATIETINMFAGLGLDNQITEFDLSVYNNSTDRFSSIPEDLLIRQGYRYRDFFDAFRQLKGKISSVTVWGLADDNTWLKTFPITRLDLPLLFDESLKAKHAYWGVVDPLQLPGADVMTSLSAETANVPSSGTASYTITVLNNGRDAAANVSMLDSIPAGTVFQSLTAPAGWSCNTPAAGSGGQVACTTGSLASGASAQFKLAVTVLCSTPDGTQVVNTAAATSTTRDPNLALNNSASANVRVSNPAPVITSLTADRSVIYPPTNKMVEVQLDYGMTDTCDNAIVPSIAVRSSQPANNPTVPDWEVVDSRHVRLRAAVTPGGSTNRVYTITLTATDSSGGSSSRSVNVLVIRLGN
ncbi:MAG TPA: endo-1,4-beta-xylanase, partial [Blastocatellia bacterium]|nr:endo-1,4-beta-xylanase [Blastocatellia bacterium]